MNPEILHRLKQFENEGRMLEQQVNHLITQKSTQKDFGDVVVSLIGSELLPHGTRGTGRKIAGKYFSNEMERAKKNAAYTADRWIGSITNYLSQVSKVTSSVTVEGNSQTLMNKFNSAKKAVKAETKISRGLKALDELQKYNLVYNHELKDIIEERKLTSAKSRKYKDLIKEANHLLRAYHSVLESILGAIERLEKGGLDANRQCLASCRNALENLVKEISGENNWQKGLKKIVTSKTRRETIKVTHQFLSAYGAHGKDTKHEDAKSGVDQSISAIRIILSSNKNSGG